MRALEFKSKIKNNQITIPEKFQSQLKINREKDVRVIILMDDKELQDDMIFHKTARDQFLKGYANSDSIYDND